MKKILLSGLLAGLAMVVVGVILNTIWQKIFPGLQAEYQTALFRPWSDPLMSLVFVVPLLMGFVLAQAWKKVGGQGKKIGGFVGFFSIFSLLGMLMTYSCFPMSFLMLMSWWVTTIVEYFVGTWILAKMIKSK